MPLTPSHEPVRVLHVLGSLNPGGIETWLLHVARHVDRQAIRMDFLVHTDQPGAYDAPLRALGCGVLPCRHPRHPQEYARNFRRRLREHGPYDILHSHVHDYSGFVLRLACRAGVPMRIAHSHNDTSFQEARASFIRRSYLLLMKRWIRRYATIGLAASRSAAASLFGPSWDRDPRWQVLLYGVDLAPFREPIDAAAVRAELRIPADAFVVGHVGRFDHQKNHFFLLEIFAELAQRDPTAVLLLVGQGALRAAIEQQVERKGLTRRVIFAGVRSDVARVMRGAIDVFLMPSWHEGLPMVLIEAQAAGLPCIITDSLAEEVTQVEPLVHRVALSLPASAWVEEIQRVRKSSRRIAPAGAFSIIESSPLNIVASAAQLEQVYHAAARCAECR